MLLEEVLTDIFWLKTFLSYAILWFIFIEKFNPFKITSPATGFLKTPVIMGSKTASFGSCSPSKRWWHGILDTEQAVSTTQIPVRPSPSNMHCTSSMCWAANFSMNTFVICCWCCCCRWAWKRQIIFAGDGCDDGDGYDGQHELYVGRPLFKAGRTTTAAACTEHLIGNSILFLGWNQNRLPEEETKSWKDKKLKRRKVEKTKSWKDEKLKRQKVENMKSWKDVKSEENNEARSDHLIKGSPKQLSRTLCCFAFYSSAMPYSLVLL